MPNIRQFGALPDGYSIQPDSELIYHDDGLIEGSLIVKADSADELDNTKLSGMIGGSHPRDEDVMLYALRVRSGVLNLDTGTFDCIGTNKRQDTDRIVVPLPSQEMIPIEAHPLFEEELAGTEDDLFSIGTGVAEGFNGARFQVIPGTKKRIGFFGFFGPSAPVSLRGCRIYQRNTPVLRATWYTWSDPTFQSGSRIVESPRNAPTLEGISNYLRSAPVGVLVGGILSNKLWKATQEYVGSEDGWDTTIYGNPVDE